MSNASLRLTILSAASMGAVLCTPAKAQSSAEHSATWALGLGVIWSPSPYRNYNNKAWPLPMVNYDGKSFYIHGISIGYRLFKTDQDEFSIVASPMGNRFLHSDSHDPQMRLLSDRDISGLAGVAWRHHAEWGVLQASAQKEFTGHGGGGVFDASYSYPLIQGSLRLVPTLGVTYNTSALNNYYYGISTAEALRSGLPSYHAGGGTSPYLGITASYQLSRSWMVSASIRYTALPTTIKNSPMVDAGHTQSYLIALSYIF